MLLPGSYRSERSQVVTHLNAAPQGHGDVWAPAAARALPGSVVLLQPGSVSMCLCCITTRGHGRLDMVAWAPENWYCSLSVPQRERESCPPSLRELTPVAWPQKSCAWPSMVLRELHPTPPPHLHPCRTCPHKGKAGPDPCLRGQSWWRTGLTNSATTQAHHPGL